MKRIRYDVPRWYIYLHRRARDLPLVDAFDGPQRKLEDEIFGQLYDGDLPPVLNGDPKEVAWATGVMSQVDPQKFAVLATECRGNAAKAAAVTKAILDAMPQDQSQAQQQASVSAMDAVASLQKGASGWTGKWKREEEINERDMSLAERIRHDERLKRIAMLAGRFRQIAFSKQKTKVRGGADEIVDVSQGNDLARLLPTELVRLASPRLRLAALRDLSERKCLQYEMESIEVLGRGPLILCVDKSGSMDGDRDIWSTAVALALLDAVHRQHRTFMLLGFNDSVKQREVVKPGRPFPKRALMSACNGGTNIEMVLDLSLHAIETRSSMARADIILVTDGEANTWRAAQIRARAKARGVRITGIGIDVAAESLMPWCDEAHCVENVSDLDADTATVLFQNL